MKKILSLCLSFFILPATIVFSQKGKELGIKAGLSIPNLTSGSSGNPLSDGYQSKLRGAAALHFEIRLSKGFSIKPQLEYSLQGGKKNGGQAFPVTAAMAQFFPAGQAPKYLYADFNGEATINYLMIPLFLMHRFELGKNWEAYVAYGPFASFLLNAETVTSGSSLIYLDAALKQPLPVPSQNFSATKDIKDEIHGFNAGFSGHLGITRKFNKGSLFLEAGGNYGMKNIQKNPDNGKNKTGAAVINIGYQFRLGK